MHPAPMPTEMTKGCENDEIKKKIEDEDQETNSSEKKVMSEKKVVDISEAKQLIESKEDGEGRRDSFETNSNDESKEDGEDSRDSFETNSNDESKEDREGSALKLHVIRLKHWVTGLTADAGELCSIKNI